MNPRTAPFVALLLAILCVLPSTAVEATTLPVAMDVASLVQGDALTYDVELLQPHLDATLNISVGAADACMDGFGRQTDCLWVDVATWLPNLGVQRNVPFALSLDHAEIVSTGRWVLGGSPQRQDLAAETPLWYGYPHFLVPGSQGRLEDVYRMPSVLLAAATRAGNLQSEAATLAGQPYALDASTSRGGLHLVLTFAPGGNATVEPGMRYTLQVPVGESWPTTMTVERLGNSPVVVARMERVGYTPGNGDVHAFAGWTSLDFPESVDGAVLEKWDRVAPGADAPAFFPLKSAARLASLTPEALAFRTNHSDAYYVRAAYSEKVFDDEEPDRSVPTRQGAWLMQEGTPNGSFRSASVIRLAPDDATEAYVDFVAENALGNALFVEYVPPREHLPPLMLTSASALDISRTHIPMHPDGMQFNWGVAGMPGLTHTPDAAVYTAACGAWGDGWPWFLAWVSAVNGQLLARRAGSGHAECTDPAPSDSLVTQLDRMLDPLALGGPR